MDLIRDAAVCRDTGSELCDLVYQVTNNQTAAVASGWLIAKPLAIITLVILALVARWLLHRLVDRLTAKASDGVVPTALTRFGRPDDAAANAPSAQRRAQRAQTMGSLLKSVVTVVVVTLLVFMAISELGFDVAPLIAGAGVVGVALGFGAQSLVKDYLSGIFMTFEDQFGVGDVVDVGQASGTIEAVSLRITRLRGDDGTIWYVRNGEVLRVGNKSQGLPARG